MTSRAEFELEVEPEPEANAEGESPAGSSGPRESVGCALGIALGLAAIVSGVLGVLEIAKRSRDSSIDGAGRVASIFRDGRPPFGLELSEASRLSADEVMLILERPSSDGAADQAPSEGSGDPDEIVLVECASLEAASKLFAGEKKGSGFGSSRSRDSGAAGREASARLLEWEKDPSFAWHTTIAGDEVKWSRWSARYRIERSFREGGTWRDSARINLAQKGRNLVVFAQWPVGVAADAEGVERVARSIRMLEASDALAESGAL